MGGQVASLCSSRTRGRLPRLCWKTESHGGEIIFAALGTLGAVYPGAAGKDAPFFHSPFFRMRFELGPSLRRYRSLAVFAVSRVCPFQAPRHQSFETSRWISPFLARHRWVEVGRAFHLKGSRMGDPTFLSAPTTARHPNLNARTPLHACRVCV